MKVSRKAKRYIAQYAENALQVFNMFDFRWARLDENEDKGSNKIKIVEAVPTKIEIIDALTELAERFTKDMPFCTTGHLAITNWDLNDWGFKFWVDLSGVTK